MVYTVDTDSTNLPMHLGFSSYRLKHIRRKFANFHNCFVSFCSNIFVTLSSASVGRRKILTAASFTMLEKVAILRIRFGTSSICGRQCDDTFCY